MQILGVNGTEVPVVGYVHISIVVFGISKIYNFLVIKWKLVSK